MFLCGSHAPETRRVAWAVSAPDIRRHHSACTGRAGDIRDLARRGDARVLVAMPPTTHTPADLAAASAACDPTATSRSDASTTTTPAPAHLAPTPATPLSIPIPPRPQTPRGDEPVLRTRPRMGLPERPPYVRRRDVHRLVVHPPIESLLLGKGGVRRPGIQGRPRHRRVASQDTNPHERTPRMAGPQPIRNRHIRTLRVQPLTATGSMQGHSTPPTAVANEGGTNRRDGLHLQRQHVRPAMHVAIHNPPPSVATGTDLDAGPNAV